MDKEGQVRSKKTLARLQLMLDKHGLLRVAARISTAKHLSLQARCPVIMHKDHPLTEIILQHFHKAKLMHQGGYKTLMAEFQRHFYVNGAANLCRKLVAACVMCKKRRAQRAKQKMAPLPDDRLPTEGPRIAPFRSTGIDVAGPFYHTQGRSSIKVWMLLFTCALYRCVHLEPLSSLDTDSFLLALIRFTSRRPCPEILRSDYAGNFTKGHEETALLIALLNKDKLRHAFPTILWIFNPPYAPHTGGFWERLLAVMKDALKAVMPTSAVSFEEFHTLLVGAEAAMNNRPLADEVGASDPADIELLTPNHFLMGDRYKDIAKLPPG